MGLFCFPTILYHIGLATVKLKSGIFKNRGRKLKPHFVQTVFLTQVSNSKTLETLKLPSTAYYFDSLK